MRTVQPFLFSFGLLLATACAGSLEDSTRFMDAGEVPTAVCPPGVNVERDILASDTCSSAGCHDADQPAGGLDLVSPGLAARIVDVVSLSCGSEHLLVDSNNIGSGYFLQSLTPSTGCGSQMPIGTPLTDEQIVCLQGWVESL